MDIDDLRRYCLQFPHATENVQWGADLCFKVDDKLFAVAALEVAPVRLSFKCSLENFAELCERSNVIPAPYLARAQWVGLQALDGIPADELRNLLAESYRLVWERLPKKRRAELAGEGGARPKTVAAKKKAPPTSSARKKAAKGRRK
jgi:predicted DNA-binding protein (MmcQ/YjbR family)